MPRLDFRSLRHLVARLRSPSYVVVATSEGWELWLEHGSHYLRWQLRSAPGEGGRAWPAKTQARPQSDLDSLAHEVGRFRNVRLHEGRPLPICHCLDDGELELAFDGSLLAGRWLLTRVGTRRGRRECWKLKRDSCGSVGW